MHYSPPWNRQQIIKALQLPPCYDHHFAGHAAVAEELLTPAEARDFNAALERHEHEVSTLLEFVELESFTADRLAGRGARRWRTTFQCCCCGRHEIVRRCGHHG